MRMQSTEAACGPCAIGNACKALGLKMDEAEATRWVDRVKKTNPGVEGTTEELLLRAINEGAPKKYRLRGEGLWVHSEGLARDALRGALSRGAYPILAVDGDAHWAVALSYNGPRYHLVDAAETEVTLSYTWDELRGRWEVAGNPPKYYALVVSRG